MPFSPACTLLQRQLVGHWGKQDAGPDGLWPDPAGLSVWFLLLGHFSQVLSILIDSTSLRLGQRSCLQ